MSTLEGSPVIQRVETQYLVVLTAKSTANRWVRQVYKSRRFWRAAVPFGKQVSDWKVTAHVTPE